MIWKESDLVDVAVDKRAIQSSISPWSSFDDASRACNPKYNHLNFAFHTGRETTPPWWMVDLEQEYPIECIKIYNRSNYQERIKTLQVEISSDKLNWTHIDNSLFVWEGLESLEVPIAQAQNARYIRLSLQENVYFHLKKVQVFVRKYGGLILSGRLDAFASKIFGILNAKYLAEKTGFKFGFTWSAIEEGQGEYSCYVAKEKEIFDEDFLKEHSYTNTNIALHSNVWKFNSIANLSNPPYEHKWGWSCSKASPLNIAEITDLDEKDYKEGIKRLWDTLPFSSRYLQIIANAKSLGKSLGEYSVIHIRNGDNLYDDKWRRSLFSGLIVERIFPLEVVMRVICEIAPTNRKIILFGVDNKAITILRDYMREKCALNERLFCINDLYNENLGHTEQTLLDLIVMSLARDIYGQRYSTYTLLAQWIGEAQFIKFEEYLSKENIKECIEDEIDTLPTNLAQKSGSLSYLYLLACKMGLSFEEKIKILNKGYSYKENFAFAVEAIQLMLGNGKEEMADELAHDAINSNEQEFFNTLLTRMPGRPHTYGGGYFENYYKFANKKNPYLLYIANKIKGVKLGK